jgi:hypothetical protein
MAKTDVVIAASPGSRALKNAKYERFCRLRALAQPRITAYREAGWETSDNAAAYSNACRLERRPEIRARIGYLTRQEEDLIAEKRRRIEERLWAIHEADIGNYFETYETVDRDRTGQPEKNEDGSLSALSPETRVRPRLRTDLPPCKGRAVLDREKHRCPNCGHEWWG